jgi:hypothetical protein
MAKPSIAERIARSNLASKESATAQLDMRGLPAFAAGSGRLFDGRAFDIVLFTRRIRPVPARAPRINWLLVEVQIDAAGFQRLYRAQQVD